MSGITLDTIDYSVHSISIKDAGGDELAIAADGSIAITDNGGSLTVDAVDLDIRDITHVSDSIKVGDGTDFLAIAADGSIAVTDNGASLTVDAVNLDIRDLTNLTDHVGVGDETNLVDMQQMDSAFGVTSWGFPIFGVRRDADTSPISNDGDAHPFVFNSLGELKVSSNLDDVSNTSVVVTKVTVDTTVGGVQLIASALSNRREITIQNLGSQDIYIKNGTGTTINDLLIPAKSSATYNWGPAIDIYAITGSGTSDVRVAEAA